jgi:cold shock CspA family protein
VTTALLLTGVVAVIDSRRFGFICPDRGGGEVWIRPRGSRAGARSDRLEVGDAVEFEARFGDLGPEALNIRRRPTDALA